MYQSYGDENNKSTTASCIFPTDRQLTSPDNPLTITHAKGPLIIQSKELMSRETTTLLSVPEVVTHAKTGAEEIRKRQRGQERERRSTQEGRRWMMTISQEKEGRRQGGWKVAACN